MSGDTAPAHGSSFPPHERRFLCTWPGISHGVVDRLEEAGVSSLHQLRHRGVDAVLEHVCRVVGTRGWRNRRRALLRALDAASA